MNKGIWIAILLLLLSYQPAISQYNIKENFVWAFGYHAGLDFNSGNPVAIQTAISVNPLLEGCATVSDTNGNLLFYCSADTIWNKHGQVMPNGYNMMRCILQGHDSVVNGWSTSQGALIVPVIGVANKYYVFSIQQTQYYPIDSGTCRLFYSIVDLSLGTGGDIVAGKKGIQIDSLLSEKMIAIPDNNCGIWLLVHSMGNHTFKAYYISSSGLDLTPVISNTGNLSGYPFGVMKCSPDRTKLVTCNSGFTTTQRGIEIYDFDIGTGIVSNNKTFDVGVSFYGACFSPDSKKLYVTGDSGITQFDISLASLSAIINSATNLYSPPGGLSDLKLGPDGKIYFGRDYNVDSLDKIDFPNLAGTACHFVGNAIPLPSGTACSLGLPNEYVKPICDVGVKPIMGSGNIFKVYPNPNNGSFTVSCIISSTDEATINVFNILGQKVHSENIAVLSNKFDKKINLQIPKGIYLLQIKTNQTDNVIRLIINQ